MSVLSVTTGRVISAQAEAELLPSNNNANGGVVVFVNGVGRNANSMTNTTLAYQLADKGYACFGHGFGGDTCGNDTFLARMDSCVTYLQAKYSKIYAVGISMGGCDILNWMRRHPGQIKACTLVAPVCKLDAIHDRNGFVAAIIEAAYGSAAAYETALPSRDPIANVLAHGRDNLQFWYSTNDTTVLPSDVMDFANDQGRTTNSQGAVGHSLTGVRVNDVVNFFKAAG